MIPLVDARSGNVLELGDKVPHENFIVYSILRVGLFSADVLVKRPDGSGEIIKSPVKWFPRLIYGARRPPFTWLDNLRIVMLPT